MLILFVQWLKSNYIKFLGTLVALMSRKGCWLHAWRNRMDVKAPLWQLHKPWIRQDKYVSWKWLIWLSLRGQSLLLWLSHKSLFWSIQRMGWYRLLEWNIQKLQRKRRSRVLEPSVYKMRYVYTFDYLIVAIYLHQYWLLLIPRLLININQL